MTRFLVVIRFVNIAEDIIRRAKRQVVGKFQVSFNVLRII